MKKQISALVDKVLTKGMAILETEKAQEILSSPQAQKAMDLGLAALNKMQECSDAFKAGVASKLGLATQKEVDALRDEITRLQSEHAAEANQENQA